MRSTARVAILPSMPATAISQRFADLVEESGGRSAVAAQLECTESNIGMIERGESLPSLRLAARIERLLGIRAAAWVPDGSSVSK